jgi:hypothetical protein
MHSYYDDIEGVARQVKDGKHRTLIGDRWEEIGRLQFEYLRGNGLHPGARLVDIGCGALRGGVHFVSYLDAGNYFGIDSNQSLIDAGYEKELLPLGLTAKLPRAQLVCSGQFDFGAFPCGFEFALAQSLFTHLPLNHLRLCLTRLAPKMRGGGRFFATFFLMPDDHAAGVPLRHEIGGVTSFDWRDPYHYYVRDLAYAAQGLP